MYSIAYIAPRPARLGNHKGVPLPFKSQFIMSVSSPSIIGFRTWPKDLGVAIVVGLALGLGYLFSQLIMNQTRTFQEADSLFRLEYPARWANAESLQDVLLKVEDPAAASPFKTALTVETRELDPSAPPTMQTLVDRRVGQRSQLTAYHFLSNRETTIAGAPAQEIQYSYVVQPIDAPRRASLPVVVVARDYIILTPTRTYYISLAASEDDFERASQRMNAILQSVKLQ